MSNKIKIIIIAIVTGFILTSYFTWPFVANLKTYCEEIGDYPGEGLGLLDKYKSIFENQGKEPYFLNFYPFPNSNLYGENVFTPSIILYSPLYLLLKDPTLTINLTVFLAVFLTYLSAFLAIYYFSRSILASILGAVIFSFSPLVMIRFAHHAVFLYRFFIPPLFLFFWLSIKKLKLKYAFLFFVFFTLNALTNHYFLFLSSFILLIIFTFELVWRKTVKEKLGFLKKFLLINLIGVIFVPFLYLYYKPYYDLSQKEDIKRNISETAFHSAQISDFFATTPNNQFFSIFKKDLPKDDFAEHVLFTGSLSYLAFIVGLFFLRYQKDEKKRLMITAYIIVVISFLFSLGPYFKAEGIVNTGAKLPYYYLYKIIPFFNSMRVPSRILLLSSFFLAMIFSFTFKSLFVNTKKKYAYPVFFLFLAFFLIEYKNVYKPFSCKINFPGKDLIKNKKVIFLPDYTSADFPQNSKYINLALFSKTKTIANGYGGYFPREYLVTMDYLNKNVFQEQWLETLKAMDMDYAVLDKIGFTDLFKNDIAQLSSKSLKFVNNDKNNQWVMIDIKKYQSKYCSIPKDISKLELSLATKSIYQKSEPVNVGLRIKNSAKCIMQFFYNDRYTELPFSLQQGIYNKDLKKIKYLKIKPILFPNEEYESVLTVFDEGEIESGQYQLMLEYGSKVYGSNIEVVTSL